MIVAEAFPRLGLDAVSRPLRGSLEGVRLLPR